MKTSPSSEVRELYDGTVEHYAHMMDAEIELPVYAGILGRLKDRMQNVEGWLFDSSCGTGHLLDLYHKKFDADRELVGIDLSPRMIEFARARVGDHARVQVGDMRDMSPFAPESMCAILSFFAVHHLNPSEISPTLKAWNQALKSEGQIVVGAWEGVGAIDYGESSNVIALRYTQEELQIELHAAGFKVDRCWAEEIEGFAMKALYMEGSKS